MHHKNPHLEALVFLPPLEHLGRVLMEEGEEIFFPLATGIH